MRYTTIIDIRDLPGIYRNRNARLVYLHLVLKSGYHDNDRDLVEISIRRLALELNLTISTIRHALHQLETAGLIKRQGTYLLVKKWILETSITARPKSEKKMKAAEINARIQAERDERNLREQEEKQKQKALRKQGKTPFMLLYEEWQRQAEAGDQEAAEKCRKNEKYYLEHQRQLKQ